MRNAGAKDPRRIGADGIFHQAKARQEFRAGGTEAAEAERPPTGVPDGLRPRRHTEGGGTCQENRPLDTKK